MGVRGILLHKNSKYINRYYEQHADISLKFFQ